MQRRYEISDEQWKRIKEMFSRAKQDVQVRTPDI